MASPIPFLNYHHLLYFRTIVREGGVTAAAEALGLTQSTLSTQLKSLEESFGAKLFDREQRKLKLTASGVVALEYAEEIFRNGEELSAWFSKGGEVIPKRLSIGALSPISKNLQYEMIQPIVMAGQCDVHVIEGEQVELLNRLRTHEIDLILTNLPASGAEAKDMQTHLLGELPVYLVGRAPFKLSTGAFPEWLRGVPLFLPSSRTTARVGFDALLAQAEIVPDIRAEVDDPNMLRLLALSGGGLSLVPEIGVKFELEAERLLKIERIPKLTERYYAITKRSKRISPVLLDLIARGKTCLGRK
jgi:LysR family transcriptional activator of nhaA